MATVSIDRAALVRRAIVELVAETGIHGASMSKVAERAAVATGTAYVHYASKEDLLVAAFVEVKTLLGAAATADVDTDDEPAAIFATVWRRIYRHLSADPHLARFLAQIDESPLRRRAHESLAGDDPLTRLAEEMASHLVDLPVELIYELGIGPAVRLAASDLELDEHEVDLTIAACWRAVSG